MSMKGFLVPCRKRQCIGDESENINCYHYVIITEKIKKDNKKTCERVKGRKK
jgi:hypothetical protein